MIGISRISSPAIWGKLPDRGDYVRYRIHSHEIDDWRVWLDKQTWLQTKETPSAEDSYVWMRLTPDFGQDSPILHPLPWSFVLSPGVLPFSGRRWVIGVMSPSADSIGRSYPLVIYQTVNQQWLQRNLDKPLGWLYWLAQLLAGYVRPTGNNKKDLAGRLDKLWAIHSPKWGGWFASAQISNQTACRELTGQHQLAKSDLRGVRYLPWANWPQLVWQSSSADGWFWQQDALGGFLDARCLGSEIWREKIDN
ncbi:type VI secretion system-associated protein TagF [Snodgrassella communis]|uniref:type VI secretion system-associated protein TagF n=1 Tax=Snodgrassella communis TaxID=2946699 RepID=UPI001EF74FD5|nr:type VI secretion system-associated protein TagF [Snodgrassella communis]